jgi:hypothetical protein
MTDTFTLVMSKGSYVLDEEQASAVLQALEECTPHILVDADIAGDGLYRSAVRVVTAHVVALIRNEPKNSERGKLALVRPGY